MRSPPSVRRGFTLVELLVVIGIIALLIAILLPALSRARAQANAVKCAAQMHDMGQALLMYANLHKGQIFPCGAQGYHLGGAVGTNRRWPTVVFDPASNRMDDSNHYVPEIMICPSDTREDLDQAGGTIGGYHSYNLNAGIAPAPSPDPGGPDLPGNLPPATTQSKYWLKYGSSVPNFSSSDVLLLADKWPGSAEWHLDVDGYAATGGSHNLTTAVRDQWYKLVFNATSGPPYKKAYKHGRSGNNYLFMDFSVRNDIRYVYDWQWAPHQVIPGNKPPPPWPPAEK